MRPTKTNTATITNFFFIIKLINYNALKRFKNLSYQILIKLPNDKDNLNQLVKCRYNNVQICQSKYPRPHL